MSFFHARPADPPRDFALLAPADPSQLAGYACNDGNISWSFCRACGVRCFAFWGRGERGEVRVEGEQEAREAWRPVASVDGEEWREGRNAYLSVNAATLEAGQEEGDLRVWHEKGWVCYLDCKDDKDENHFGRPAEGGMY
ncbi:MAG: hypothetical protein INR71_04585 [Terriglobus roseus]|nr:hypothetical protein [Terriglobus roseus]